jgi:hypothetical protein
MRSRPRRVRCQDADNARRHRFSTATSSGVSGTEVHSDSSDPAGFRFPINTPSTKTRRLGVPGAGSRPRHWRSRPSLEPCAPRRCATTRSAPAATPVGAPTLPRWSTPEDALPGKGSIVTQLVTQWIRTSCHHFRNLQNWSLTCDFGVGAAGFEPTASSSRSNNNSALTSAFPRVRPAQAFLSIHGSPL